MFRSSRPDYIETQPRGTRSYAVVDIVPVFQTGLH